MNHFHAITSGKITVFSSRAQRTERRDSGLWGWGGARVARNNVWGPRGMRALLGIMCGDCGGCERC